MTLYGWFDRSARRYPDRTALEVGDTVLTYRRLAGLVERFAGLITAGAGGPLDRIGVLASRTPGAYVAYLAGLRAGAAVVPISPGEPHPRMVRLCADAAVDMVVGDGPDAATLGRLAADIGVPGIDAAHDGPSVAPAPVTRRPGDVAYIMFTSGSTGRPKGVPITHRAVSRYLDHQIPHYDSGPDSRWSQNSDLTFDLSVLQMFAAWGAGGAVVVPRPADLTAPVEFIGTRRITHWVSVPSLITYARRLRMLAPGRMPGLRLSVFGGEQLTVRQALAWRSAAPASRIENLYGPTEVTVSCTGYRLPADPARWPRTSNGTVPIGTVLPHLDGLVVGADGAPAAEGELCVRGVQRFSGYLDPAADAGRFLTPDAVPHDPTGPLTAAHWYRTGDRVRTEDGVLVHLDRLDDQVKVHGFRIEPGEVETVVRTHPGVDDVVVVAVTAPNGSTDLVAAYTGRTGLAEELSGIALAALPRYAVPRRFVRFENLSRNRNGKIDRRAVAARLGQSG
jgi:amino acid adenylation domain-containing protein